MKNRQVIIDNIPLAICIAKKHTYGAYSFQDVLQDAYVGLCIAFEKWDESRGPYNKLAGYYIMSEIKESKAKMDDIISHSRRAYSVAKDVGRLKLEGLTSSEIEEKLNLPKDSTLYMFNCFSVEVEDIYKLKNVFDLDLERLREKVKGWSNKKIMAEVRKIRGQYAGQNANI